MTKLLAAGLVVLLAAGCDDGEGNGTDTATDVPVDSPADLTDSTDAADVPVDSPVDLTDATDVPVEPDAPDAVDVTDTAGDPDATDTPADGAEAALLEDIAGTWHGMIGAGYRNGCLCLTLDSAGNVISPSGITGGFTITGGSTTIVDVSTREIDILTIVSGVNFHIQDAFVNSDGTVINGQWVGETIHDFDDTITLDRDPASCLSRTGLTGAPC